MHDPSNISEIVRLFWMMFWSFMQIFIICDASEYVTDHFERIDLYNQCNWYEYPANIRRIMPIVIANTQRPVVISAYGNILCTRETFKRVKDIWFIDIFDRILLHSFIFLPFSIQTLSNRWRMVDFHTSRYFENSFRSDKLR